MTSIHVPEPTDRGGLVWIETQVMGAWYQKAMYRGYSIIWNPTARYNLGLPKINPTGWAAMDLSGMKIWVDNQIDADPLPSPQPPTAQQNNIIVAVGVIGLIIAGYIIKKRRKNK